MGEQTSHPMGQAGDRNAGDFGLRSAAGGRNEETYSKYAEGIQKNNYPSRRQHKQVSDFGG